MAAATKVLFAGPRQYTIEVTGTGADETETNILDISTLTSPDGGAPSKVTINEIWWSINNFGHVLLERDRDTDDVIGHFAGQGYMDYRPYGGNPDKGTGGTGDILLSSVGGSATAANNNFSFIISVRLKD